MTGEQSWDRARLALVIPDLPVDEAAELAAQAAACGVAIAPLAAPTSTDARLDLIAAAARSFIYCVSVTGVTGARSQADRWTASDGRAYSLPSFSPSYLSLQKCVYASGFVVIPCNTRKALVSFVCFVV